MRKLYLSWWEELRSGATGWNNISANWGSLSCDLDLSLAVGSRVWIGDAMALLWDLLGSKNGFLVSRNSTVRGGLANKMSSGGTAYHSVLLMMKNLLFLKSGGPGGAAPWPKNSNPSCQVLRKDFCTERLQAQKGRRKREEARREREREATKEKAKRSKGGKGMGAALSFQIHQSDPNQAFVCILCFALRLALLGLLGFLNLFGLLGLLGLAGLAGLAGWLLADRAGATGWRRLGELTGVRFPKTRPVS